MLSNVNNLDDCEEKKRSFGSFGEGSSKKRIIGKTHETVVIEPKQIVISPKQCNVIFILGLNSP